jgi:hypothetical protein
MRVKRGQNYPGLNFSGPQSTNVINEAEELAERLEARNQWAYQMGLYYPDLPRVVRVERCTEYRIKRFKRDLILRFDASDGWWEIDGYMPPQAAGAPPPPAAAAPVASTDEDDDASPADDSEASAEEIAAAAAAPDEDGDNHSDDDTPPNHSDGDQPRQPKSTRGSRKPPPPKPDDKGDEFRPISVAPRRAMTLPRPQSELAMYLWKASDYVRRSSLGRHTMSVFEDTMAKMKRATAQFVEEARDALVLAYGFSTSFSNADQIVQENWFGAVFEPQTYEQAGRRLTLLTFSAYPKPNWESWLFGRLPEDQQVAV